VHIRQLAESSGSTWLP